MSMPEHETSPFARWNETAAVRAKPALTDFCLEGQWGELGAVQWFVFGGDDGLMSLGDLQGLGLAARNRLGAARLVRFMDETALTEHRLVNVAAQAIAERRLADRVPPALALDALKLYTDEAYHAWFSAEAGRAIRQAFDLPPNDDPSLKIPALEALAAAAPPVHRDLAWFLVGFAGETQITQAIVENMRSTTHSALQAMLLAHLEDEWVHARYFDLLFSLLWPGLDAAERAFVGRSLPAIMAGFHILDRVFLRRTLVQVGLDEAAQDRVLEASEKRRGERLRSRCTHTLEILARCGVFEDTQVRRGFVQVGLIDADQPPATAPRVSRARVRKSRP